MSIYFAIQKKSKSLEILSTPVVEEIEPITNIKSTININKILLKLSLNLKE